jgi:hypothetical protein
MFSTTNTVPEAVIALMVLFFSLKFSSIQILLNYSATLTARNDLGTERDGWTFGMERMAYWLRLGRVGIMTDYGSTHDGRKEIDLFVLSC